MKKSVVSVPQKVAIKKEEIRPQSTSGPGGAVSQTQTACATSRTVETASSGSQTRRAAWWWPGAGREWHLPTVFCHLLCDLPDAWCDIF